MQLWKIQTCIDMGDLSSLINFDFHVDSVQNISDEKIRDKNKIKIIDKEMAISR